MVIMIYVVTCLKVERVEFLLSFSVYKILFALVWFFTCAGVHLFGPGSKLPDSPGNL